MRTPTPTERETGHHAEQGHFTGIKGVVMAKNSSRHAVIMMISFGILGVIALTFNRTVGIGLLAAGVGAFLGHIIYGRS
jgi:hypothetical protein